MVEKETESNSKIKKPLPSLYSIKVVYDAKVLSLSQTTKYIDIKNHNKSIF